MPLLIGCLVALWTYMFMVSTQNDADLVRFVSDCDKKGGIVLNGERSTGGWYGCYKGLIELENEK